MKYIGRACGSILLKNVGKDRDFGKYLEKCDFVGLTEWWMEEGSWKTIENRLPKDFISQANQRKERRKRGDNVGENKEVHSERNVRIRPRSTASGIGRGI